MLKKQIAQKATTEKKGSTVEKRKSLQEIQAICLKEKDCLIMRNYRRISTRITRQLYTTGILPWHITLIGFAIALLGAGLFLLGEYKYLVAGVVLLQVSYILDCVDGEIARINKTGSGFGAWIDSLVDSFSIASFLGAAAIGQYFLLKDASFLLVSIPAIINFTIVPFMISSRARYVEKSILKPTFSLGAKSRIGNRSLSMVIISVGVLANQVFLVLAVFATLWTVIWVKMTVDFFRLSKKLEQQKSMQG